MYVPRNGGTREADQTGFAAVGCACRWLAVYGGLTAGVIVVALLRASLFFWATIVAATRMHNSMVLRVLRAPLSFFHTNPAGRVLNRFSNDQVGSAGVCAPAVASGTARGWSSGSPGLTQ